MKRGFTLIEVLVTVTILSVLVGVLLPNLTDLRKKARDQRRVSDLKAISEALESYKNDQTPPSYPDTADLDSLVPNYIKKLPTDPIHDVDDTRYNYDYERDPDDTLKYKLQACMEQQENSSTVPLEKIDSGNPCDNTVTRILIYELTEP